MREVSGPGHVHARHIVDNMVEAEGTMMRHVVLGARSLGMILLDVEAVFPSVGWPWIAFVLPAASAPARLVAAVFALFHGSVAQIVFAGIVSGHRAAVSAVIAQGCPTFGGHHARPNLVREGGAELASA